MLYPLKFKPLFKERIWGGRKMESALGKKLPPEKLIGESWELSGVAGDVSVVSNGTLRGNSLDELLEIYMGDLVGDNVFERFGPEFPLLVKLIDAADYLSIQVHPDDALAAERHNSYGKTEMWYVIDHEPGAQLYLGFNQSVDRAKYLDYLAQGKLEQLLNSFVVSRDDAYFIPARAIHAIGKGILIAEIQQTSDVTYRVYDFNRRDAQGKERELHTALALDSIDFVHRDNYAVTRQPVVNEAVNLQSCKYFETNTIMIDGEIERDYALRDSFVIYVCLEGDLRIETSAGTETIHRGETVLMPAILDYAKLTGRGKILETYIPEV